MTATAAVDPQPRLLFTAPWEPVIVRRGDALGLRALADQFAEALAPDLSNRVRDGGGVEKWRDYNCKDSPCGSRWAAPREGTQALI